MLLNHQTGEMTNDVPDFLDGPGNAWSSGGGGGDGGGGGGGGGDLPTGLLGDAEIESINQSAMRAGGGGGGAQLAAAPSGRGAGLDMGLATAFSSLAGGVAGGAARGASAPRGHVSAPSAATSIFGGRF